MTTTASKALREFSPWRFNSDFVDGRVLQPGTLAVFGMTWLWATSIGIFIQLIVLPYVLPQLHAGHGLMVGGDWVGFHPDGLKLADAIASKGWSEFELRPQGNAPIAISGLVYLFTGVREPWILVPVSAAIFSVGAVSLFNIFTRLANRRVALFAIAPFVLFPSSVLLYAQIHKDVWSAAGFLMLAFVWAILAGRQRCSVAQYLGLALLAALATFSIWLVRPYMCGIILGALVLSSLLLVFGNLFASRSEAEESRSWIFLAAYLAVVAFFAFGLIEKAVPTLTQNNPSDLLHVTSFPPPQPECVRPPHYVDDLFPSFTRKIVRGIVAVRAGQRAAGLQAGSLIDGDVCIVFPSDVIAYVPRAVQIAVLSPFPHMWFTSGVSPGARLMRSVAGVEMMVSYIILIGIFGILFFGGQVQQRIAVILLSFSLLVLLVLATSIPNVGTLYRMRFGNLQLLLGLGVIGWFLTWQSFQAWRSRRSV